MILERRVEQVPDDLREREPDPRRDDEADPRDDQASTIGTQPREKLAEWFGRAETTRARGAALSGGT